MYVFTCVLYICASACDSEAYHLEPPPWSRARWWWQRRAFPPSWASARDHVSPALCKQETCARSALSVATVMRVTLVSLHTQRAGHLNHAGREEEGKKTIIGWPYLAICNKALKALVWQSRLDGCACNKRKAIIHPCFIFFLLRYCWGFVQYHWEEETDW